MYTKPRAEHTTDEDRRRMQEERTRIEEECVTYVQWLEESDPPYGPPYPLWLAARFCVGCCVGALPAFVVGVALDGVVPIWGPAFAALVLCTAALVGVLLDYFCAADVLYDVMYPKRHRLELPGAVRARVRYSGCHPPLERPTTPDPSAHPAPLKSD